jgi:HJR/Mrr/RecB family endonuclease
MYVINIPYPGENYDTKLGLVKTIKNVTGLGLKESKEIVDQIVDNTWGDKTIPLSPLLYISISRNDIDYRPGINCNVNIDDVYNPTELLIFLRNYFKKNAGISNLKLSKFSNDTLTEIILGESEAVVVVDAIKYDKKVEVETVSYVIPLEEDTSKNNLFKF